MGTLTVTPKELFQFCLICSPKVKSLPLVFVLPYACTEADGGDVTGAGDVDVEFRGFDIQPACFDFRAQGEGGAVDIGL